MKLETVDLKLCQIQGKIFEESIGSLNCSSQVFIRRFMNSKVAKSFDDKSYLAQTSSIRDVYDELEEEYGAFSYGKEKFSMNEMHWIGYVFRCMSIAYGLSSKQIYKMFPSNDVRSYYFIYHTFDIVEAAERMLETKGYDFSSVTDKGKKIYRRLLYNNKIRLEKMTTELAHKLFIDFKNDEMLFEDKKDFKEFIYDENQVNNYVQNKEKDGYILLAILYEDDVIGEIRFKGIEDSCSEIGIVLKNDRYKNKGMGTIALSKALDYAKDILKLNKVIASILKTNKRSQHIFEKIGFIFYDEDDHFDKFYKKL